MDLRQIEYFIALYEKGSMTRAAAELGIVQPALSMQIAKLEKHLGVQLFQRSRQGVRPTGSGERYFDMVAPLFRDFERIEQTMFDQAGKVTGDIKVGVNPSLCVSMLPAALSAFLETYPDVSVEVTESYSEDLESLVADGILDLALVFDPGSSAGFVTETIIRESLYLVSQNVGGAPPRAVPLSSLAKTPLILMSQRYSVRRLIDHNLAKLGLSVSPRLELNGLVPTLELVKEGRWSTVLAPTAVIHEVNAGTLRLIPITRPVISRSLVAIHTHRRPLSLAAEAFLKCIKEHTRARLSAHPQSARLLRGLPD